MSWEETGNTDPSRLDHSIEKSSAGVTRHVIYTSDPILAEILLGEPVGVGGKNLSPAKI